MVREEKRKRVKKLQLMVIKNIKLVMKNNLQQTQVTSQSQAKIHESLPARPSPGKLRSLYPGKDINILIVYIKLVDIPGSFHMRNLV